MRSYYVPFYPAEKIDYITLFAFYDIADFNTDTAVYDTINYQSVKALSAMLNLSVYAV